MAVKLGWPFPRSSPGAVLPAEPRVATLPTGRAGWGGQPGTTLGEAAQPGTSQPARPGRTCKAQTPALPAMLSSSGPPTPQNPTAAALRGMRTPVPSRYRVTPEHHPCLQARL